MIGMIGSIVGNVAVPLLGQISGAVARSKELKLSFTTILRSLYFEIDMNQKTLDLVKSDKLKPENLAALASALEIETCVSILFADDSADAKAHKFLDLHGKVQENAEEDGDGKNGKREKSVLRGLLFIVQRVIALRKIAAIYSGESESNALINVRVPVRIENIRHHLDFIKRKLIEFNKEDRFLFG